MQPDSHLVPIQSILDRLSVIRNDYSQDEVLFQSGVRLVDTDLLADDPKPDTRRSAAWEQQIGGLLRGRLPVPDLSIVIPIRGGADLLGECLNSINRQTFVEARPSHVEVIVVEDGVAAEQQSVFSQSSVQEALRELTERGVIVKRVPLKTNVKRAKARNAGLCHATRKILFLIDGSMVLDYNFLAEHMWRHERVRQDIALLGFKQDITWGAFQTRRPEILCGSCRPDPREDLKWKHEIKTSEAPEGFVTFRGQHFGVQQTVNYMLLTDYLRGMSGVESIGFRSLPSFFQTNIVSVNRDLVVNVGGFHSQQQLWGLEDTLLGALLVTLGCRLVPCPSSLAFNLRLQSDEDDKDRALAAGRPLYESLIRLPFVHFERAALEREFNGFWNAQGLPPPVTPDKHVTIATPKLFRGTIQSSKRLIGRDDELKALDAAWGDEATNVVTIVAWGGVGKTSLAANWAAEKIAQPGHSGIECYFDWSFYYQGTRRQDNTIGAGRVASSEQFIKEALEFFGDPALATSNASAWQKGERLAKLAAQRRTLLILDGLEPLQDAKTGELRDDALCALLRGLATDNCGLCLVTTRQHLPELDIWRWTTAPEWDLARLTNAAGASLLEDLGVQGPLDDREQLSEDVKGHALTLTLLGNYLANAHDGDVRRRNLVSLSEADHEETSGHAFRVMEAYERWLERDGLHVELAVLRLLGLFDRPATPDCLAALRAAPISGLTDKLVLLTGAQWSLAVKRLIKFGLVDEQPWNPRGIAGYGEELARQAMEAGRQDLTFPLGEPKLFPSRYSALGVRQSLDAHPLIREFFAARLREMAPEAWREAHGYLFEHLEGSVPYWPEGLDGLLPLYQAIVHGCQAGRYQTTYENIYVNRIARGIFGPDAYYSRRRLGLLGADLSAVSCFFIEPWRFPAAELTPESQSLLFSIAALDLRSMNRLAEVREPLQTAMERYERDLNWQATAICANNLSELEALLGDLSAAANAGVQAVAFADCAALANPHRAALERIAFRATHAYALHQMGRVEASESLFKKAEDMQAEREPNRTLLYGLPGHLYCDLLMAESERTAWRLLLEYSSASPFSALLDGTPPASNTRPAYSDKTRDAPAPELSETLRTIEQRAIQALEWNQSQGTLLRIALDNLTLGRAAFCRALLESSDSKFLSAISHLNTAYHGLRQTDRSFAPRALLARAWLRSVQGLVDFARADLDEAQYLAERGPLPLLLADIWLYRARLFFRDDAATAREELKMARILIENFGYFRRLPELEDAETVVSA